MFSFKSHYRLVQNVLPHTPKFVTTTRKENCSELKIEQLQRISEKFITQAKVNERKTQTGRSYDRKSFVSFITACQVEENILLLTKAFRFPDAKK